MALDEATEAWFKETLTTLVASAERAEQAKDISDIVLDWNKFMTMVLAQIPGSRMVQDEERFSKFDIVINAYYNKLDNNEVEELVDAKVLVNAQRRHDVITSYIARVKQLTPSVKDFYELNKRT